MLSNYQKCNIILKRVIIFELVLIRKDFKNSSESIELNLFNSESYVFTLQTKSNIDTEKALQLSHRMELISISSISAVAVQILFQILKSSNTSYLSV